MVFNFPTDVYAPIPSLSSEDIAEIAHAGDVVFTEDQQQRLQGAFARSINAYRLSVAAHGPDAEHPYRVQAAKAAKALGQALRNMNEIERLCMLDGQLADVTILQPRRGSRCDAETFARADLLQDQIAEIARRASRGLHEGLDGKRRTRPKSNAHFTNLFGVCAEIYEEAGGEARTGSSAATPFGKFLHALHRKIPNPYRANSERAFVEAWMSAKKAKLVFEQNMDAQRARASGAINVETEWPMSLHQELMAIARRHGMK